MVYWITGKAKAGKTTLAGQMANEFRKLNKQVLILDGDVVRKYFPCNFDDCGRWDNIKRIATIAKIAEEQNIIVIVACISPKKEWRMKVKKMFYEFKLFYVPGGYLWEGTQYEEPDEEELN